MMALAPSAVFVLIAVSFSQVHCDIVCGDSYSISVTSSDSEWGEWGFVDPSDISDANMYINDVLSLENNARTDVAQSDNLVESAACWLTTTTNSLDSGSHQLQDCKPDMSVNDTHIMYEYSVWNDPRNIAHAINRWPPARVCYTCVMERDAELNSVAIAPQMTIDHYEIAGVEGTFSLELTLWTSGGTQLNADDTVDVGDEVTIKAEMNGVDSTDDTLVLYMMDCWASPTTAYFARYQFVEDTCPVDQCRKTSCDADEAGYTTIVEQANDLVAKVTFTAFVWNSIGGTVVAPDDSSAQKIYITCRVNICSETYMISQSTTCIDEATCDDGDENSGPGARRRRRAAVSGGRFKRGAAGEGNSAGGPSVLLTASPFGVAAH